ncbi:MAG: 4'-phosphopantetheinyl transferase superfamily protein [Tannerella sp.]|jgi:phosphopantetheinyl transferase|nr:4'-phosphopantetheinyl transferase superfamily protein [Tannerella sp.]
MPVLLQNVSPLWGIWKIEESWKELLAQSEQPDRYLPFLSSYKSDSRKAEWLAVRLLLKALTGAETTVAYRPDGSPFLPDLSFHISISHTKGYAAVLLHPDRPVGIDIEYCSERIRRVTSRFLDGRELTLLGKNPSTASLLICWSAKETVFKMTGQTAVDWQKDIHILAGDFSRTCGSLTLRETLSSQPVTRRIYYGTTPEYVITRSD